VVTLNPWEGIQTAVTRQTTDGKRRPGSFQSSGLALPRHFAVYAWRCVRGPPRENRRSIEQGKLADVIIVSQNIFEIDPRQIAETKS